MEQELKDLLKSFLRDTAGKIDRDSFQQEPSYTSAFFGKLHNERLETASGNFIEMSFSSSNDRGPGAAEKKTGIDIGMVFKWTDPSAGEVFAKAVLAQAKNKLPKLSKKEFRHLSSQCQQMGKITNSYIALDCPYDRSIPTIFRSSLSPPYWHEKSVGLDEYLTETVFECLDGDTTDRVIDIAKRADRRLVFNTNAPRPNPKPKASLKRLKFKQ